MESVMVFDIGTTMVKGGLLSYGGKLLSSAFFRVQELSTDNPSIHEMDPDTWIEAVKNIAGKLLPVIKPAPPERLLSAETAYPCGLRQNREECVSRLDVAGQEGNMAVRTYT